MNDYILVQLEYIVRVLDESTMRILNNEFVPMLKKNSRIISDSVAKEVKWQLKK